VEGGDQGLVATIDDKVVAMSFESSKFEQGVSRTISSLDKLKAALKFPEAGKGLEDINKSAQKVDLGFIARAIESLKGSLSSLRLVAIGVMTNIANRAVAAGARFVKAFTLDPIKAGFGEYTTNLNAVQTILSNTKAAGTTLKDVNRALQELNEYSDKTIYNFSQMAKNIGTFTAAGVDLDTATGAIKGIANLAALSGSNAEQASTAMYQLSQAISAGRVSLQDWNSVVNAGMGGTVFQRALAQTAVAMGSLKDSSLRLVGPMKNVAINGESFRQSIQAGPGKQSWLTSKVLTTTLKQFTGDLTAAELKAQGFNDAQIKAIQQTGQMAMHAATEVKTLQGVLDTAKETAGSGWAQTWQIIFGDFGEAKKLFTDVSNAVNDFINASADARNEVLADWKALGGRTVLIEAIKNVFQALGAILKPIKEAFRDIFPAVTGRQLAALTKQFKEFTETLMPSPETVDNLKRTFRGLFALLDIGKMIVQGIFTVFGRLFGALDGAGGGFLSITARIGDFLYAVDQALRKGERLDKFFVGIGTALAAPIKMLVEFKDALVDLFGGRTVGQVEGMTQALTPFQRALNGVSDALDRFFNSLGDVGSIMKPVFEALVNFFSSLGPAIGEAISHMNFEAILAVIRTGLFGALVLMLRKFAGKGSFMEQLMGGLFGDKGLGPLAGLTGSLKTVQSTLQAYQTNLKAKTLREIAIAIALLVASIVALSFVDPKKLSNSMAAITIAFGQLIGAMALLEKVSKSMGFIKMPLIAASLIMLAGAIDLLTVAVIALSFLSWEELAKGLGGITVLLAGLAVAAGPLGSSSAGLIRAGVGITALAIALNLLALAVRNFGSMSFSEMAQGLGGIAVGLELIAGSMKVMPKGMALQAAALIGIATALRILANVVKTFGELNWTEIAKGMAGIGGGLVIIAGAMRLMPPGMVASAAGLLLVSFALGKIASAVESMGGMSISQMAKGLISLAASLAILAGALYLMEGAIGGAAALAIAAAGLALLTPALIALGKQSWKQIVTGLVALASALAVLALASVALAEAIPFMIALGAALTLIGAGIALAGAGVALIGIGLAAIATSAPIAAGVIVQAFVQLQKGIIENAKLLIVGLLQIVRELAKTAPQFVDAIVKILSTVVDAIIKLAPKMREMMNVLIQLILDVLAQNQDKIIQAGFDLLIALLKGIRNNLPAIVRMVAEIVVTLIKALGSNLNKIIRAGFNLVISFVKGIVSNYSMIIRAGVDIVVNFIKGLTNSYSRIISAAISMVTKIVSAIASNVGRLVTSGVSVITNFLRGISSSLPRLVTAAVTAITRFINAMVNGALRLVNVGAQAIIKFMNGVADAIDRYEPQMIRAGARIGVAIVRGMIRGIASLAPSAVKAAGDLVNKVKDTALKKLHIKSPSGVFEEIGKNIVLGMANGMSDNSSHAEGAASDMSNGVIDAVKTLFQITSPSRVMQNLGREVTGGFADGLRKGTAEDVNGALADLNMTMSDAIQDAQDTIAEARRRIAEERAKKPKEQDKAAIREAQQEIKTQSDIIARLNAGRRELVSGLGDEKRGLIAATAEHERLVTKLDEEQNTLEDLIRTRDDYRKSIQEQYSELPDVTPEDAEGKPVADALGAYTQNLASQIEAVATYAATLQRLRGMGLDDETYKKLLAEGPSAQAFATQLEQAGPAAVKQLGLLSNQLEIQSQALGNKAAANLYDAGVKAQQGLVNGLTKDVNEAVKKMNAFVQAIVNAVKKKLKIKSPSQVFAEIGQQTMAGMAQGISNSSQVVVDSVNQVALDAVAALQNTMQDIADVNPVITPVLDLTQVQTEAEKLAALTNTVPITAAASYGQASAISAAQMQAEADVVAATAGGTSVKFEQNNYSPESLSEVEIYRQTKNQLSQLKSAFALT